MSWIRQAAGATLGACGGVLVATTALLGTEAGRAWLVSAVDKRRMQLYNSGIERPKRIILFRGGQGAGYAHTSGTDEDGKIHCSELPHVS